MGGAGDVLTQPLVLEVISVFPDESPWASGATFDLVEPAGYVRAGGRSTEGSTAARRTTSASSDGDAMVLSLPTPEHNLTQWRRNLR